MTPLGTRRNGRIVDAALDARTIGLDLVACQGRLGRRAGATRHAVVLAVLRARNANVLVTDAAIASFLPDQSHE